MFAAALKQIDGMRQQIDDAGERLARPHGAARKVHDELALTHGYQAAGERRPARFPHPFGAHQLRQSRDFPLGKRARHLGRCVARPEARPAGREDGVAVVARCPSFKLLANLLRVIRQDGICGDLPAMPLEQFLHGRTGLIPPASRSRRVTQYQDFGAKGGWHEQQLTQGILNRQDGVR